MQQLGQVPTTARLPGTLPSLLIDKSGLGVHDSRYHGVGVGKGEDEVGLRPSQPYDMLKKHARPD